MRWFPSFLRWRPTSSIERMHELLERNTEGTLASVERAELETLVKMAEFAQLLTLVALEPRAA